MPATMHIAAAVRLARKAGINTLSDLHALLFILEHGEPEIGDISTRVGVSNSTATQMVDRFERLGLVRRERDLSFTADRRNVKAKPTFVARELGRQLQAA